MHLARMDAAKCRAVARDACGGCDRRSQEVCARWMACEAPSTHLEARPCFRRPLLRRRSEARRELFSKLRGYDIRVGLGTSAAAAPSPPALVLRIGVNGERRQLQPGKAQLRRTANDFLQRRTPWVRHEQHVDCSSSWSLPSATHLRRHPPHGSSPRPAPKAAPPAWTATRASAPSTPAPSEVAGIRSHKRPVIPALHGLNDSTCR